MRLQALVGVAVVSTVSVCAGQAGSTSAAQTTAQAVPSPYMSGRPSLHGPQVMLEGCVTSGATSFDPFTLAAPTLVGTVSPGVTASTSATSISLSGGARAGAATSGSLASAGSTAGSGYTYTPGATGTAGTTGTSGTTAGTAGTQGTNAPGNLVGTSPAPASSGTAGATAGGGAAGTPSTMSNLRLRGTGLSTLAGQRVQVVGTLVPGRGAQASMAPGRELSITSIVPIGGTCP